MTYKHPILDNRQIKKIKRHWDKIIKGFPKYYKKQERKLKWQDKDL